MARIVVTVLAFQAAWGACLYGAVTGVPLVGAAACFACLGLGLSMSRHRFGLAVLALGLGGYGFVAETLLVHLRLVTYASAAELPGIAPIWIVSLWMAFATLVEPTFGWLRGRPLLSVFVGGVMGPLAYAAAGRLGALSLAEPMLAGLSVIALIWALALTLAVRLERSLAAGAADN